MDWLRRNWPDLIIGVALVAVVALIVVTLLSGGSLASLVRRDSPPTITDTTPGTATPADAPENTTGAGAEGNTQTAGNGTPSAGSTDPNSADPDDTGVDVFVPGVPGGQADTAGGASGGQTQANTPGGSQSSGGVAQSGVPGDQADAAANGPLPEATQDGGFRVAAGAVDSRDAAASLAETFRDADYAVTVEQQGGLYLLWVGPYAARAGADQVAARLQTDGLVPDALVYSYESPNNNTNSDNTNSSDNSGGPRSNSSGNTAASDEGAGADANTAAGSADAAANTAENTGAASVSNTGNSAANAEANTAGTDTGTNATATASAGNAAGRSYLQVGAFATDESAQPLREQLETLGFNVSRRQSGTGLVRLLVGPLGDAQIAQAQARLSDVGITDAFPVAP